MKNLILKVILTILVSVISANLLFSVTIKPPTSVEIKVEDVSWTCTGDGDYTCTSTVEKKESLTNSVAESIRGDILPTDAVPVVITTDETGLSDGDVSTIPNQFYTGLSDPKFMVLDGEWDDLPYNFPAQTITYSSTYGGYIGYFLNTNQ